MMSSSFLFTSSLLYSTLLLISPSSVFVLGQTQVTQVCNKHSDCGGEGSSNFCEEDYSLDAGTYINKCSVCSSECFEYDRSQFSSRIAATQGCPESCCDWELDIDTTHWSLKWLDPWKIAPCADAESLTVFGGWIEGVHDGSRDGGDDASSSGSKKSVEEFAAESIPCGVARYDYADGLFPVSASIVDCSTDNYESINNDESSDVDDGCDAIVRTYAIWTVHKTTGEMKYYQDFPVAIKFGDDFLCDAGEAIGKTITTILVLISIAVVLSIAGCVVGCYCCFCRNKNKSDPNHHQQPPVVVNASPEIIEVGEAAINVKSSS